jgi:arylsulfatase A-like enzyme
VNEPDILILLCDTARADAFRPWDAPCPTPVVEALSRRGTAYLRAASAAPWTLPSVASIFTGRLPTEHQITAESLRGRGSKTQPRTHIETTDDGVSVDRSHVDAPEERGPEQTAARAYVGEWLPETLLSRGYQCFGASCNPWVSTWRGFDRGFHDFVDVHPWRKVPRSLLGLTVRRAHQMLGTRDHGGRQALDAFGAWMQSAGDAPRFAFINLMELHDPYDPPPRFHPAVSGRACSLPRPHRSTILSRQARQKRLRKNPDHAYIAALRGLYYSSARYEDHLLGQFITLARQSGRPTVVVVVSDHGENLGDHGLFEHHSSLHETLLHVPLVVAGLGLDLNGGLREDPVSLLALADWLGRSASGDIDLIAPADVILSEYEGTVRRPQVARYELQAYVARNDLTRIPPLYFHPGLSVKIGDRKYVTTEDGREWVYDLKQDPRETAGRTPLGSEDLSVFRSLRDEWLARRGGVNDNGDHAIGLDVEKEMAEHLRMLGYLE